MVPPYAIGAGAPIMSKPPAEQITEVGSESAGDPEKAAEQSVEGRQPTECLPKSAGKEVEETEKSQPNRQPTEITGSDPHSR
ncbi:hypothetical protein E5676_scaffold79610G00020 [Cucumis melo var. makuwa]|uniref:Uncharacterized protein n=1 Tax=Cucumis melo var. makuwa TaxID=1194695 RepID=A0A5A7TGB2_CUCMM|nr:hypothetical protein E6C27_scaffold46442G00020 [Cucumis melo var. makuwa]TYK31603.1 hypothetical protein E5676_scaffold79610G00020 [Cucumis melo var. makuwa]